LGVCLGRTTITSVPKDDVDRIGGDEQFKIIHTRQAGKKAKGPRVYYRLRSGFGPDWEIPNNDIKSNAHAVLERVFFVKLNGKFQRAPKPWDHADVMTAAADHEYPDRQARKLGTEHVNRTFKPFLKDLEMRYRETGADPLDPLSETEFVDAYTGSKKKLYAAAVESLKKRPFDMRKDSRVTAFVKDEYSKGVPRIIQPRSPRFNVMLGRHIKHVEHTIYETIDCVFDPSQEHVTVQKGRNPIERGNAIAAAWFKIDDPVCIETDAARFDQHLNEPLLDNANSATKIFCSNNRDEYLVSVKTLLDAQRRNVGRVYNHEGTIKYKVRGCGMSGDMNTSLRNVIVMCGGTYEFMKQIGVSEYFYGNDGDDGWLITSRRHLKRILEAMEAWWIKLGITMKIEGVSYNLEDITFCQGRPVYTDDNGYVLMPIPQKRLYADLVTTKNLASKKVFHAWVGAVAGCGLSNTRGVPVLQNHYQWLARTSYPWVPSSSHWLHNPYSWWTGSAEVTQRWEYKPPSIRSRISFYFAFDIAPAEQLVLEKYYDNLDSLKWTTPVESTRTYIPPIFQALVPPVQKDRILDVDVNV
jgi:hypothetical protein